jgi:hypothetical protein
MERITPLPCWLNRRNVRSHRFLLLARTATAERAKNAQIERESFIGLCLHEQWRSRLHAKRRSREGSG